MKKQIFLIALLLLTGCASAEDAPVVCPGVGLMQDADAAAFFANADKKPTPDDVAVYAVMRNVVGACKPVENGHVAVELVFDITAQKNVPDQTATQQNLSYFIAVLGPNQDVLQRESFYANLVFDKDVVASETEEHTINIPVAAGARPGAYTVIAGFALTPEQLLFNRTYHAPHK